jgi:DNA-directed RNA polymerase sigma subunit (sigma70/sigma32)
MRQRKEQELAADPHWEKLPKLLDLLTSTQRQVIEGLYLQQPPLARQELQRRLRLTALELRELEQGALRRMREGVG